jgi:hypothetical protein
MLCGLVLLSFTCYCSSQRGLSRPHFYCMLCCFSQAFEANNVDFNRIQHRSDYSRALAAFRAGSSTTSSTTTAPITATATTAPAATAAATTNGVSNSSSSSMDAGETEPAADVSTDVAQNNSDVRTAVSDAPPRALLMNLKKGAEGLNLVEANFVFLLEPVMNAASEAQAINRVHRIGQLRPTTVKRFIIRGASPGFFSVLHAVYSSTSA